MDQKKAGQNRTVGAGPFTYEEHRSWAKVPAGWDLVEVTDVAVDSLDRVFVFSRSDHPVTIFNRDGSFVGAWGEGRFKRPHAIFIGPDDAVFLVDDYGNTVYKFTPDGKLLMSIDRHEHFSDTGYVRDRPESIVRAGDPFNNPTAVALSPEGDLYVTDGYGNARVHKFSPEGKLLFSWGEPGNGPGQFLNPHAVFVDRAGLVYVSDRRNYRVQIFDPRGRFVSEWKDVHSPNEICADASENLYIAELGAVFLWGPNQGLPAGPNLNMPASRVTVRDTSGKILAEWGETDERGAGRWFSPHGIAVDSKGDLYLGEVPRSYGGAPPGWPMLRKYVRRTHPGN